MGNAGKVWFQNLLPQTTSGAKCVMLFLQETDSHTEICMHVVSWEFAQEHFLQVNEGSRTE